MRRISFLSRPVSGTLLSRPVQLGLARCHLSSSVILPKEPSKGLRREICHSPPGMDPKKDNNDEKKKNSKWKNWIDIMSKLDTSDVHCYIQLGLWTLLLLSYLYENRDFFREQSTMNAFLDVSYTYGHKCFPTNRHFRSG